MRPNSTSLLKTAGIKTPVIGFYDVSDQPVTLDLRVQIVEVGQDRDYHLQEGQLRVAKFARS